MKLCDLVVLTFKVPNYENICDNHHSSNFKYQSRDSSGCQNLGYNCLNGASSKRAEIHEVRIRRFGINIPTKANE